MRHTISIILAILLPLITKAQLKGIWGIPFGASPEETIKAKKFMKPYSTTTHGNSTVIIYSHCLWEGRNYSMIELQYHDKHLNCGMLTTAGGYLNYQAVVKSIQQQYGAPKSSDSDNTNWTFCDQTDLTVINDVAHGYTTVFMRKEPR